MTALSFIFSTLGIIVTLVGSLEAAMGFIGTRNKDLFGQASTYWSFNPELYESLVQQRDKTIGGFVLIFLGTILQLLSVTVNGKITVNIDRAYYLILLIISSIVIFLITELVIKLVSNRNINLFLVPRYYKEYRANVEALKGATEEISIKSKKANIENYLNKLGKRLRVNKDKYFEDPNKFEVEVIRRANNYPSEFKEE
ncbi:hypothetical protein SAMN05216378_2030 [Paenibacillus catalpae]|uniref:Uncharacterized protein n=1 Tax=Paenibacillus catalpae TaxID=1045775 RepID=A0A1I1X6R1_9BACL|nr:hypothetical protein [Paenibacillus catalpae]SFE02901.1 hypothetical protein SAMN05216378_2030 [Paenibacillus catalpae]